MKILLTGEPRSGKSTILEKFTDKVANKLGLLAREVRDSGERTGFLAVASTKEKVLLASTSSQSDIRVSRYGVNVQSFDEFIQNLPSPKIHQLLYVDEIGQMQLYSANFKSLVSSWLDSKNLLVGTISKVYNDEFTNEVRGRNDVVIVEVTPTNRDILANIFNVLAENITLFPESRSPQDVKVVELAREYVSSSSYTQLRKLFHNALPYVASGKVAQHSEISFIVNGNHDDHLVSLANGSYSCDCDLFLGKGEFIDSKGECSHIQSVYISQA